MNSVMKWKIRLLIGAALIVVIAVLLAGCGSMGVIESVDKRDAERAKLVKTYRSNMQGHTLDASTTYMNTLAWCSAYQKSQLRFNPSEDQAVELKAQSEWFWDSFVAFALARESVFGAAADDAVRAAISTETVMVEALYRDSKNWPALCERIGPQNK